MIDDREAVALLESLLAIPSLCGQEEEFATALMACMVNLGYAVARDAAGNVCGTIGGAEGAPTALILGHMDTAPGAVLLEQRGGALYGRGAVDAKGPLVAGVIATARSAGRTLRVQVIGAVQEEGPSTGARHLVSTLPAPDWLIIAEPSGWDAVVLGYKGSQRFSVCQTRPWSHSAGPERTAPEILVDFWNRLRGWCAEQRTGDGEFNRPTPTLLSMTSNNNGLTDEARLEIGLRLPPGFEPEQAPPAVRALLPEGEFTFSPGEPAVRSERGTPLVAAFVRAIRAEGGVPRFKVKTGTSDMNVVGPGWRCPMLAYGPGDARLDHTPMEHVSIDEFLRGVRVLSGVLSAGEGGLRAGHQAGR